MADISDYTPEILGRARKYLEDEIARAGQKDSFPSIAELSLQLGKARSTIYKWANEADKSEFSDILEKILALQEAKLVAKGLDGTYNSTITKLMLTKHGYSDKIETDLTSKGEKIIPIYGGLSEHVRDSKDIQAEEEN